MTDGLRHDAKWWGWGNPEVEPSLDGPALAMLQERIGPLTPASRAETITDVSLPDPEPLPPAISGAVGEEWVSAAKEDRVRHAVGRGYPDLVRLRAGNLGAAPDAVVAPADSRQVRAVIEACAAEGVAVVPFGGGTSVVGGVEPVRGAAERLISLDLARLRSVSVDGTSLTATLGAGLRGPEAEHALGAQGLTLGHFPQSFEYATVGGFAATRSAGQASSGYGRFDALVSSVRLLAPAGEISTQATPHTAAGPSLRELIVGSEGVLGAIPDVTVRVRPAPERRRYEAWFVESFEAGAEAVRAMAQGGALPDVVRLSDEEETRMSLALSGPTGAAAGIFRGYLRLRGVDGGCILIAGIEGDEESVARRRALAVRVLRSAGAVYVGTAAGRSWERGRYHGPYLRDTLMDAGAMVETLETAGTWSGLAGLYSAVRTALNDALEAQGTPGTVFCHISHAYPDGASLYFTFIARAKAGEEIAQWRAVKSAACDAILDAGGTITHHHAVGRDHAPYMPREIGPTGIDALRALKEQLDPAGIMNPGKLLPD